VSDRPTVYVDECGVDTYLYREHARSVRGAPVLGGVCGRKHKRVGIVAAQVAGRVLAPCQYDGTMDSGLFEAWFSEWLLPVLPEKSVIVMDNASFHRKGRLRLMAEAAGHSVLFLPPYSPELNPIENFWAWLKRRLRKILPDYSTFDDAFCSCFKVL